MTEPTAADQWNGIEKEVEARSRARDMERIKEITGTTHCPVCGHSMQDCCQCSKCGFKSG